MSCFFHQSQFPTQNRGAVSSGCRFFGLLALMVVLGPLTAARGQEAGEQIFNTTCFACHTIGGGRLVGPDLAGIQDRRSGAWLEKFINSSGSLIESGDPDAVAVFEEYNRMPMPDAMLSGEQVERVLSYIKASSVAPEAKGVQSDAEIEVAAQIPEQVAAVDKQAAQTGGDLFQGSVRFVNRGPSCNACHHLDDDNVFGGGVLAADLTRVFSRMGAAGLKAVVSQAPYPVMRAAYKNHALTATEVTRLVAFLQQVDQGQATQQTSSYATRLFAGGAGGAGILFLVFGFVWRGRKTGSVYQAIYDRQAKLESGGTGS